MLIFHYSNDFPTKTKEHDHVCKSKNGIILGKQEISTQKNMKNIKCHVSTALALSLGQATRIYHS